MIARLDPPGGGDRPEILYDRFLDREFFSFVALDDTESALWTGLVGAALQSAREVPKLTEHAIEAIRASELEPHDPFPAWATASDKIKQDILPKINDETSIKYIEYSHSKKLAARSTGLANSEPEVDDYIKALKEFSVAGQAILRSHLQGQNCKLSREAVQNAVDAATAAQFDDVPDLERQRDRMIALYVALVNDLRRGWHAIRVHERSRDLHERARDLQGANESRMPLYTLKTLRDDVFYKSGPIKGLMEAFSSDKAKLLADAYQSLAAVSRDEKADYAKWAEVTRQVGRKICDHWPIPAKDNECIDPFPAGEGAWLEVLSRKPTQGEKFTQAEEKRKAINENNSRAARLFVWLLYGLAPSLPAIIHMELASHIYGSKLRNDPESGKIYNEIKTMILHWEAFVHNLSISFRYIKMKCLQLYAAITIESMLPLDSPQTFTKEEAEERGRENGEKKKRRHAFLHLFLCLPDTADENAVINVMTRILRKFDKADENLEPATGLAIMPDMAPSTLFGESWLTDLMSDKDMLAELKEICPESWVPEPNTNEAPQDMKGIFGETEQWLWATDRCLKKFRARADALLR